MGSARRLYLTFDLGTTALKTALVDGDGRLLGLHVSEYSPESPRPGWVEMRPESYWNAVRAGTRAVFSNTGVKASELAAICFSSQAQTFIPVDDSGEPLHNAIVWLDCRAEDLLREWCEGRLTEDEFRSMTGHPRPIPELAVFKIAWLARNQPLMSRISKFLQLPDYIIRRLTGENATDYNMAQMSGLLDVNTGGWNARLLSAAQVDEHQLPAVHAPGTLVGYVLPVAADELGVPSCVPVCVGANDQLCGALGAGNTEAGVITETTGTALAAIATVDDPPRDPGVFAGKHAVTGKYYALSYANTSAVVLKWFRDLCAEGEEYDAFLSGVEGIPPGSEGLSVLPHFSGIGAPFFNPQARGAIVGLTLGHTRSHIARAIIESCACLLRDCVEPFRDRGQALETVRSLGGAARSDVWLQIKSDMLGVPVERPACSDAASLGAAMLAAKGTGQFASVKEASDTWYRPSKVFRPDPENAGRYEEVYQRYMSLCKALY